MLVAGIERMSIDVYVGLGSNIEPARHLREAVRRLEAELGPARRSHVYRGPPYGFSGDDFLNLVVGLDSGAAPSRIEAVLSAIEDRAGRSRQRHGSRTLDLDLLLYGSLVDARLRLPRADVLEYPFVLAPLAELAPDRAHPVTGERYAQAWRRMAAQRPPLTLVGSFDAIA